MIHPLITVREDFETGEFTLFATSYGQTSPAGVRLFHGPPHPVINFSHPTEAGAEADAQVLRDYIAKHWAQPGAKKKTKKQAGGSNAAGYN